MFSINVFPGGKEVSSYPETSDHFATIYAKLNYQVEVFSEVILGEQVLVPDVPNKIYIQVKSKFLENDLPVFEPVEFSKVNLVH